MKTQPFIIDITPEQIEKAYAAVGRKSPPKGYPDSKTEYADPKNYKYPVDSEEHVRAAWSYINQEKNQKDYTPAEISAIKSKIKKAGKKYDIDFSE